jgi:Arc/MetJ-type ribon-helix-helix transcriptional regulator
VRPLRKSASEVVREALRVLEDLESDREHLEVLLDEADLEPPEPGGRRFWKRLRAELKAGPKRRAA